MSFLSSAFGKKSREEINLLDAHCAIAANDVRLEPEGFRATGRDPYIIYKVGPGSGWGSKVLELEIEALEGRLYPRVYFQVLGRWSQANSVILRRTGANFYKIHFLALAPVTCIRLDPAEIECFFKVRRFTLKPSNQAVFFKRVMRGGLNSGEDKPRLSRLLPALRRLFKRGFASEIVAPATKKLSLAQKYSEWIATYDYNQSGEPALRSRLAQASDLPKIAVVMPVFNTPRDLLDEVIGSVVRQVYGNWELCIADDCSTASWVKPMLEAWKAKDARIKVIYRETNGHISEATNSAFSLVESDYVAMLDHDDVLRPNALAEVALAINANPDAQIIYSDEDKIDTAGRRYDPFFKPGWNPLLFFSQNYLNHLTVHRSENIRKAGGWRSDYIGSQDYDLNLRVVAQTGGEGVVHIPKILYHWRATENSTALNDQQKSYAITNAKRALADFTSSQGIAAEIEPVHETTWHRIRFALPPVPPLVSLIIPTRNGHDILKVCIDSITAKTTYPDYEIIIVDNGSDDPGSLAYFEELEKEGTARVLRYDQPFNYSAINNFAVAQARGEIVGLINNDIEVITPGWLDEMVSLALRPGAGCIGAKLYYPNDTIQHAGIVLGIGGVAGHSHKYFSRGSSGYYGRLKLAQNISAVTGACLVVRKSVYEEVGGLDAEHLSVAFNDVDFCLRVREAGYANAWTPHAELYHHESLSRGAENSPEKQKRFIGEVSYMLKRWGPRLTRDPNYSPNLTLRSEDFSVNLD